MFIDFHRHAADLGTADRVLRNLFHNQSDEIEPERFYSMGLHPWHVDKESLNDDIEIVRKFSMHPQILAIGETGLDKSIKIPFDIQLQAFQKQIEIASKVNKPMIIHCVRAYNEVFELKMKSGIRKPWMIHWFNASKEMGLQLIEKGFYLSFGHMLFNEKSKAYKTFQLIPLEKIFFETDDAGYNIDEIYVRASQLLSISLKDLELRIEQNFNNFFGRKP
jgi:TatD DNase family protein